MLFNTLDFYLLRVPALPLLIVSPVHEQSNGQLRALWDDGKLDEALFVSSPSLHKQITDHLCTNGWPLPTTLQRTLWKYALRMSSRATPFGLMAGCSVGTVTNTTQVTFDTQTHFVPHHRLDMDCVAQIVRELVDKPTVRSQLRFFPTNVSYIVSDELRYIEYEDTESERHYYTASVTASPPLMAILQRAQTGATLAQLAELLITAGIDPATAATFVDQLIEQQLLVSDLEPMLTGPSLLTQLKSRLQQLVGTDLLVKTLMDVKTQLATERTNACTMYQAVHQLLTQHFSVSPLQPLIQTDSFVKTSVNQLNRRVLQTILGQIERLLPLQRSRHNARLVSFSQRFRDRYEDRTVPLLVALDADIGVGYADAVGEKSDYSFLLDGLTFASTPEPNTVTWGSYENLLVEMLSRALYGRQLSVELIDDDLVSLNTTDASTLPCSFYLFGNLLGASPEAIDGGDFQFNLLAAEGPSAANLLGRFASHSPSLTDHVRRCLQREEQQRPEVIYAEIIHWPSNRVGNVLQRPPLRQFEIPLVSRASVDESNQLTMNDLMVSVRPDGRVMLWSKWHQKEVIPRLSTAHNYRAGLSIYQFLADLQRQDSSLSLYWDWGPLRDQVFLPRITYRNLILSRARWTLRSSTLPLTLTDGLINHLRITYQLPRWVAVAEGDNELVIDLETDLGHQLLADEVRRHPIVRLVECVTTPERSWLRDGQGAYISEVVIPCETLPPPLKKTAFVESINHKYRTSLSDHELVDRSFHPGSEWLYVKLYSGVQIADGLLKELIFPFLQKLRAEGTVQNWFFIRYADPEPHLRLRLQGTTRKFHGPVLERLHKWTEPYRKSGVIYRVQIDTYERELDRYGASIMTETESIFEADSWATLRYLAQESDPADRWQFALRSCHTLLADFELGNREKANLLRHLQEQFLAEHQADRTLRQQLNARFRVEHEQIILNLSDCPSTTNEISAILAERSVRLRSLIQRISTKRSTSVDKPSLPDLLAAYLHMSLNRLFASKQRMQEMVIYHFLARYYESNQARQLVK